MKTWMRTKKAKMARAARAGEPTNTGYRRIAIKSAEQLKMLRGFGWREAGLYQVTEENRARLAWFVYANGAKWINILTTH